MDEEIPDPQTNLPTRDPMPQDKVAVPISTDPRWPYLGKWSATAIPSSGAASAPAKVEKPSNSLAMEDIASSSVPKNIHLLDTVLSDDDSSSARLSKLLHQMNQKYPLL